VLRHFLLKPNHEVAVTKKLLDSCFVVFTALTAALPYCASAQTMIAGQSGAFTLSNTTAVSYGANGAFNTKTLIAGSYVCGDPLFGDPAWGVPKACYVQAPTSASASSTSTATALTMLTGQSGSFKLTSTSTIAYGWGTLMTQKSLASGSYVCGDQLFGDPAPGKAKACYSTGTAAATVNTSQLKMITGQSGSFTLASATKVTYGTGTKVAEKLLAAGTYVASRPEGPA